MRAIRIHETGGAEVIKLEQIELEDPGPTEVLVLHEAIGVNYIDIYHRSGVYPLSLPSGLGLEACGIAAKVGERVTTIKPNDRVAYATGGIGAYADARLCPEPSLIKVPEGLDSKTVAASLLKGMTAESLIRRAFRVESGQKVVFHAAAGGVGQRVKYLGVCARSVTVTLA